MDLTFQSKITNTDVYLQKICLRFENGNKEDERGMWYFHNDIHFSVLLSTSLLFEIFQFQYAIFCVLRIVIEINAYILVCNGKLHLIDLV